MFYIVPTVAVLVVIFGVASIVLYTSGAARRDSFQRTILWGVGLAIVGFVSGFVGPALLSDSGQGPLLGIFLTGPAGAALGCVIGATRSIHSVRKHGAKQI
jgi:zinc transporter ZupT